MNTALSPLATGPAIEAPRPRRRARYGRWLLLALLASVLLATALVVTAWWAHAPLQGWDVVIDGERMNLPEPSGWQAMGLVVGLMVAAFALLVVVPLALLFGLALPLVIVVLVLGGLVAGAFGIGMLLLSPLLLPVVLVWWLLRRSSARPTAGTQG